MPIIRDALFDDIRLSKLEYDIVNTVEMLRLNRLRQLHLAYYVYPSATHSRYAHSIGCRAIAEEILRRSELEDSMTGEEQTVLYLSCLLHDVSHACFEHVLMAGGFPDLVDHEEMLPMILNGRIREFYRRQDLVASSSQSAGHEGLNSAGPMFVEDVLPDDLKEKVLEVLTLGSTRNPKESNLFFIHQLVSSAIDIDNLEYLLRDPYFLGVSSSYDDALLSSFRLGRNPETGTSRLAFKDDRRTIRSLEQAILARWHLFDRAYLHHAVMAANTMLIKALRLGLGGSDDIYRLYTMGDDDLLLYLLYADPEDVSQNRLSRARELIQRLLARDLFKRAYAIEAADTGPGRKARGILNNPEEQNEFHRTLEREHGIDSDSYSISKMPAPWKDIHDIQLVNNKKFGDREVEQDLCDRLKKKYDSLRILYVFSHSSEIDHRKNLRAACEDYFDGEPGLYAIDEEGDTTTSLDVKRVLDEIDKSKPPARKVLECLLELGESSNEELAGELELKAPTISQYLNAIVQIQERLRVKLVASRRKKRVKHWSIASGEVERILRGEFDTGEGNRT